MPRNDSEMANTVNTTVIKAMVHSLEIADSCNTNDVEAPCAVLWTDQDFQWQAIVPLLRKLLPQLLTYGEYQPEQRIGPAIWLRSVVDNALSVLPAEATPILYLPGVGRQQLRAVQECPDSLKPLVELQYRGICWTQKNGKDWTVEAFLVADEGGLGLDLARDTTTRGAMFRALAELATTPVSRLQGKRLEAEDFDRLLAVDPIRDLLRWLNEPELLQSEWSDARWSAFQDRCKADFRFDPEKDGELVAAQRLTGRKHDWAKVWERFEESPQLYPGVPELLRKAGPDDFFDNPSCWPQNNDDEEARLREALLALEMEMPAKAYNRIRELEKQHGPRRDWVWEKLDEAPLANALAHLAVLAVGAATSLGGASHAEMAKLYSDAAWKIDLAALSAMAAVKLAADARAVSKALDTVYRPWLESAAEHFQELALKEPLPGHDGQPLEDVLVEPGGLVLFADGLRFDVAQCLMERMNGKGWSVTLSSRWAGLPTVTATAKPAVSPVSRNIKGESLGEHFLPVTADKGQALSTDGFRKLLSAAGYQYLRADETGDPSGRGWAEDGELDELGHSLGAKLADVIEKQIDLLLERLETLFEAGWSEICVVTDHGWLWLPGGLPRVDLPKYLTQSRWSRCAAIEGASRVEVPTVSWHWNALERVAVAPGIACFKAGHAYAHGGLSLQECLTPLIRVTAGAATARATPKIAKLSWARLRCRLQVEAVQPGLTVQLRTQVNDPESSLSQVRTLDSQGASSLLVEDDELEGASAVVVVLDANGRVLAKQSTLIGGDD